MVLYFYNLNVSWVLSVINLHFCEIMGVGIGSECLWNCHIGMQIGSELKRSKAQ